MTDTTLEEADDRLLLQRHTAGDPDAFGEIYRRHRDRMWAVAVGVCGDHDLAAEAVQEAFLSAFRRAGSYRGDAAVTTWLHRIVINACIDQTRRVQRVSELRDTYPSRARTPETDTVDSRLLLLEGLAGLPEGQRVALVLVDMYAFPVADAAHILDVAPGTVKSRCARGREALATVLRDSGVEIPPGTSAHAPTSDSGGDHAEKGGE